MHLPVSSYFSFDIIWRINSSWEVQFYHVWFHSLLLCFNFHNLLFYFQDMRNIRLLLCGHRVQYLLDVLLFYCNRTPGAIHVLFSCCNLLFLSYLWDPLPKSFHCLPVSCIICTPKNYNVSAFYFNSFSLYSFVQIALYFRGSQVMFLGILGFRTKIKFWVAINIWMTFQ